MFINHILHRLHRQSVMLVGVFFILLASLASLALHFGVRTRRPWMDKPMPVAFWAWRDDAPTADQVEHARRATANMDAIFLRAGQIDYANNTPRRIRRINGDVPRAHESIKLHLVYNATRSLLTEFERTDLDRLAATIADAYREDAERVRHSDITITGLQLDIDAATRLLPRYAELIRRTRKRLPTETTLSITGLPTWLESKAIDALLQTVDFWTPQLYGTRIPERLDERRPPISSARLVGHMIPRLTKLKHPFYVGLPTYGYAALYSGSNQLISLRGDLNPADISCHPHFEMIERQPFTPTTGDASSSSTAHESTASEWRYVYQATRDTEVSGLSVRAGERLMFDVPTAEALRRLVNEVRGAAGENLLGICLFRLPSRDDATTLTLKELTAAISDAPTDVANSVRLVRSSNSGGEASSSKHTAEQTNDYRLIVICANDGAARALLGKGAFAIDLHVQPGSLSGISKLENFVSIETLCNPASRTTKTINLPRPCSLRRANIIRLHAASWTPGTRAQAVLKLTSEAPQEMQSEVTMQVDDGRKWQRAYITKIEDAEIK